MAKINERKHINKEFKNKNEEDGSFNKDMKVMSIVSVVVMILLVLYVIIRMLLK